MSLLPIDSALLDLGVVDEDESDAVALCLIEYIFSEANLHYYQHCRARKAIVDTARLLTDSLFDVITTASLQPDAMSTPGQFGPEPSPTPEINDRHAALYLPFKSPEKKRVTTSESGANSDVSDTSLPSARSRIDRTRSAPANRRLPSRDSRKKALIKPQLATIPQVVIVAGTEVEEAPDLVAWRAQCLQDLANVEDRHNKRPVNKWSRPSPAGGREVEVIDNCPHILRQELVCNAESTTGRGPSTSLLAVKMKTTVNTFSNVHTPRDASDTSCVSDNSNVGEPVWSHSVCTIVRRTAPTYLDDGLSRSHHTRSAPSLSMDSIHLTHAGLHSNPRLHDETDAERRSLKFTPDSMSNSMTSIPTVINMAPGVSLAQGEIKIKGPVPQERPELMSRKRYELHQHLAKDHHFQNVVDNPLTLCSPSSSISSHEHHQLLFDQLLTSRPLEQVVADAIFEPTLSDISKSIPAIPHIHLPNPLSSARVRNSAHAQAHSKKLSIENLCHFPNPSLHRNDCTIPNVSPPGTKIQRHRISQIVNDATQRPQTSHGKPTKSKYRREFAKPPAGMIRMADSPIGSTQQIRKAWL